MLEHVDAHLVGGARVHVVEIFARPGEALAAAALEAVELDAARRQHVEMRLGKIMADDAAEMHRFAKHARSQRGIRNRAAEQALLLVLRGDDVVDANGAGDDE